VTNDWRPGVPLQQQSLSQVAHGTCLVLGAR
jgi:hypothetical protein